MTNNRPFFSWLCFYESSVGTLNISSYTEHRAESPQGISSVLFSSSSVVIGVCRWWETGSLWQQIWKLFQRNIPWRVSTHEWSTATPHYPQSPQWVPDYENTETHVLSVTFAIWDMTTKLAQISVIFTILHTEDWFLPETLLTSAFDFFLPFLIKSRTFTFHLKEALYSFCLARVNCQHHFGGISK